MGCAGWGFCVGLNRAALVSTHGDNVHYNHSSREECLFGVLCGWVSGEVEPLTPGAALPSPPLPTSIFQQALETRPADNCGRACPTQGVPPCSEAAPKTKGT